MSKVTFNIKELQLENYTAEQGSNIDLKITKALLTRDYSELTETKLND